MKIRANYDVCANCGQNCKCVTKIAAKNTEASTAAATIMMAAISQAVHQAASKNAEKAVNSSGLELYSDFDLGVFRNALLNSLKDRDTIWSFYKHAEESIRDVLIKRQNVRRDEEDAAKRVIEG
jgi:hypothetical protein